MGHTVLLLLLLLLLLPEGGAIKSCCSIAINRSKLPQESSSISILINAPNKWHIISEFKTWVVKSLMYYFLICKSFTCQSRLIFMHWLWKHQIEMESHVLQFFFQINQNSKWWTYFPPFDKICFPLWPDSPALIDVPSVKCVTYKTFLFFNRI